VGGPVGAIFALSVLEHWGGLKAVEDYLKAQRLLARGITEGATGYHFLTNEITNHFTAEFNSGAEKANSPLFDLARLFVRFDHFPRYIVNANYSIMCTALEFRVADCITECVWLAIPQATEWQRVGD
jgi:hypothetical protein